MKKVIHCRDVGSDCDGVIKADNEADALKQAAQHAREVHGVTEVTPEVEDKIKSVMEDEG
jgi:predicted small metal-binding protein